MNYRTASSLVHASQLVAGVGLAMYGTAILRDGTAASIPNGALVARAMQIGGAALAVGRVLTFIYPRPRSVY